MMSLLAFLTLCGTLLLANAQPSCNTTCDPNLCSEGALCPRFLNADCEVNTCDCTPRFIFRRRDVTDRCGVSCDTRECGTFRQCMEEVVSNPTGCTGQTRCRQRLRTRCVRIPRPMTCEDVDCGEGMMCQVRERRNRPSVVRCVPALPTTEPPTTTGQTTTTTPTFSTPASTTPASTTPASTTPASTTPASTTPASTTPASTTPASTTPASTTPASTTPASTTPASTTPASTTPASTTPASTTPASTTPESTTPASTTGQTTSAPTTQSPLCGGVECSGPSECIDFPPDFPRFNGPTCFPVFRLDCESLSCSSNQTCIIQSIPAAELSLAACFPVESLEAFTPSTCENITCEGEDAGCFTSAHPSFGTSASCLQSASSEIALGRFLIDRLLDQMATSTTAGPVSTTSSTTASSTTQFPFTSPLTTARVTTGQTTSAPTTQPSGCNDIECQGLEECIDFPLDLPGSIGPMCFDIVRLDCESLPCPDDEECITQSIHGTDISLALCSSFEPFTPSTCENITCEDSGCVLTTHPTFGTSAMCGAQNEDIILFRFLRDRLLDQMATSTTAGPVSTTSSTTASSTTEFLTTGRVTATASTPVTSTPTQATGCNGIECNPAGSGQGTECIEFPPEDINGFSGPTCFPVVRLDCESLSCTADLECITQSIQGTDLSLAVCIPFAALQTFTPSTCDNITCEELGDNVGCFLTSHLSFGSSAMCLPNLNESIALGRFLEDRLVDQMTTSTTGPVSTTPTPFTDIFTTLSTTASPTPTESPLCIDDCSSMGLQCVPFPVPLGNNGETITVGICLPIIGLNCEDITCPVNQTCILQSFVERDLDIAQCVAADNTNPPQLPTTSCAAVQCTVGSVCVDLRIGDMQLIGTCLPLDCSNNTQCDAIQSGDVCVDILSDSGLGISSVCVPSFADPEFGMQTCAEIGRECPAPLTCQEAYFNGLLVSTICSTTPLPSSCNEIVCEEEEECLLTTADIIQGTLASCVSDVNATLTFFQQVLEILGFVDASTTDLPTPTPTELMTTLSTFSPSVTTESSCSIDCASFGQTCEVIGGIASCVRPTICTAELMVFCEMTFQECRESDGLASCVPRTSCDEGVTCPDSRFQCYEFMVGNVTAAQCLPPIGPSCDSLSCDDFAGGCTEFQLPLRNVSIASCIEAGDNAPIPTTCDTMDCSEGMVCVDLQRAGVPAMGACLTPGCATNTTVCDSFTTCTSIPSEFGLAVDSVCVPSTVNPQVGTETCAESGRVCTGSREVCLEAVIEDTLVGTSCSPVSRFLTPTCQNQLCLEGDECTLEVSQGSPTVQDCISSITINQSLQLFMDILGSI